jgi:REP element-mobilizing transposase RayT
VSHVQHHLYFHVVWATKLRAPAIIASVRLQVWAAIGGGVVAANGRLEAIGGVADHVHLLIRLPPTVTLASVIKRAKGASSHLIGHIHPELGFAWQEGYAAFSVEPAARATLVEYIANQQAHHASGSSRREWEIAGDSGTVGASPPQADFVVTAQEFIPGL